MFLWQKFTNFPMACSYFSLTTLLCLPSSHVMHKPFWHTLAKPLLVFLFRILWTENKQALHEEFTTQSCFCYRSMDMVHAFEVERVQALRFIRKVSFSTWFLPNEGCKIVTLALINCIATITGYLVVKTKREVKTKLLLILSKGEYVIKENKLWLAIIPSALIISLFISHKKSGKL